MITSIVPKWLTSVLNDAVTETWKGYIFSPGHLAKKWYNGTPNQVIEFWIFCLPQYLPNVRCHTIHTEVCLWHVCVLKIISLSISKSLININQFPAELATYVAKLMLLKLLYDLKYYIKRKLNGNCIYMMYQVCFPTLPQKISLSGMKKHSKWKVVKQTISNAHFPPKKKKKILST